MIDTRLILLEGMAGTGKTTNPEFLPPNGIYINEEFSYINCYN